MVILPRLGPRPDQDPVLVGGCGVGRRAGADVTALCLLGVPLLLPGRQRSRR